MVARHHAHAEDLEFAERGRRVLDIAEQLDDWFLKTATYFALALDLAQQGFIGKAREWATMSIALGEDTEYSPARYGACVSGLLWKSVTRIKKQLCSIPARRYDWRKANMTDLWLK